MKLININKKRNRIKITLFGSIKINLICRKRILCKDFKNYIHNKIKSYLNNNFSDEIYFYSNPYCGNKWEFSFKGNNANKLLRLFHKIYDINSVKQCYDLFENQESKNLYIDVLLFRLLGPQKVRLPLSEISKWENIKKIHDKLFFQQFDETKNIYNLSSMGYDIRIITSKHWIFENLCTYQYIYENIKPKEGDFVIDGGACFGDNSLCFASMVGPKGHVYSFELLENNIAIFNKNIELNSKYKENITIIKKALYKNSKEDFSIIPSGGATRINNERSSCKEKIKTLSLDDAVSQGEIKRIDFIKLDIEGAELNCLEGAKNSIKTFKPQMAISLYHCDSDYCDILLYLKSLVPEYKFYFNHHTAIAWESILYVTTDIAEPL